MGSYEILFARENGELYERIKHFVPLLPDFRPIDTVNKMKRIMIDGKEVIEPQNAEHCSLKGT